MAQADVCTLLTSIRDTLLRIEDAVRVSDSVISLTAITTGTATDYSAADTYRFSTVRNIQLCLWDKAAVLIQLANDVNREWSMGEIALRGPQSYRLEMLAKSFRIRAVSVENQAEYLIVLQR